jgi:HB1, ASXL, restriction endonuclease HTH domain
MTIATEIENRIETRQRDILELEGRLREQRAYLQALIDTATFVRMEVLRKHGKPMRVGKILEAIGKHGSKKKKLSISGLLSHHVRNDEIFFRQTPNVFGLREWNENRLSEVFSEEDEAELKKLGL